MLASLLPLLVAFVRAEPVPPPAGPTVAFIEAPDARGTWRRTDTALGAILLRGDQQIPLTAGLAEIELGQAGKRFRASTIYWLLHADAAKNFPPEIIRHPAHVAGEKSDIFVAAPRPNSPGARCPKPFDGRLA